MGSTATVHRRAVVIASSIVLLLLAGLVEPPSAGAGERRWAKKLLDVVNATRERRDLRVLKMDWDLWRDAKKHTRRMMRNDRIFDPPNLQEIMADYQYDDIGADVVGCGHTLKELHRILMTEDFHRTILLHEDLRRAGMGVYRFEERNRCGRGSFWATELFYG